jgi:biopolymer transport protein ExbB
MKRLFVLNVVSGMLFFVASNVAFAQNQLATVSNQKMDSTAVQSPVSTSNAAKETSSKAGSVKSFHNALKQTFIEGGPIWMTPIFICLILGLAFSIERIIYLNLSTTNTKKLLIKVEDALNNGGIETAKEVCLNTRGPVAFIFYQGLERSGEGLEAVEKSIISYGGLQAGLLEKGLSWIALFIALSPMLGFLGTVVGIIHAFNAIGIAGEILPSMVAAGIKVALITTVAGLIVAIILQIFYNYFLNKIDSIVGSMEDSSISFIDLLVKHHLKNIEND